MKNDIIDNYRIYKPSPALSELVSCYWSLDGAAKLTEPRIHRTLANFKPELIFHYGGTFKEIKEDDKIENTFIGGLHGQTDIVRRFTHQQQCGIFGVMLHPYAIPALFGIPATEVKNELIDLQTFLGIESHHFTEQILNAAGNEHRVTLTNHFLEYRLKGSLRPEIPYAVQQIYNLKGIVNVKQLSNNACLSPRQFERVFKEQTGFTAKSFSRLVKFKALLTAHNNKEKPLMETAYDFGYYDQSHLIGDFKKFCGYTPYHYFNGRATEVFYAP